MVVRILAEYHDGKKRVVVGDYPKIYEYLENPNNGVREWEYLRSDTELEDCY